MKTLGGTKPRCGWFQRISASKPISFWVLALISGWKTRWNCFDGDRLAKVGLEADAVLLLRLQLGREIAGAAAAGVLRLVKREVGLEDQVVDRRAVDRAEGAADRHADADLGLVDHVGLLDRVDDAVGELLDLLAALRVGDDDREFVAAHAADMAVGADFVDQPLGDRAKHRVALRVAEGVVDRLEAVEVEEHDRARHIAGWSRARSASPSSWRTRPRLGRPDSTSTLARWVSRSCVWRISVMSEPTPRKPSKRPAVSMIGSPAIEIQRGPRGVCKLHLERVERLLFEQHAAELGMAAEQAREANGRCSWLAGLPSRALMRELM